MKETVVSNLDILGAELAGLSSVEQAEFFKGFLRELDSFGSVYKTECQMFAIKELLTKDEQEWAEKYISCLWYESGDQKSINNGQDGKIWPHGGVEDWPNDEDR